LKEEQTLLLAPEAHYGYRVYSKTHAVLKFLGSLLGYYPKRFSNLKETLDSKEIFKGQNIDSIIQINSDIHADYWEFDKDY
jgi:hypothetical protein